jgi:hypothetical protein
MREWTPQSHLQEAFRQELFRLINQYLSFPDDATHGKIVRTLVTFQQAREALEGCAGTLVMRTSGVDMAEGQSQGRRQKVKFKTRATLKENGIPPITDTNLTKNKPACASRLQSQHLPRDPGTRAPFR